MSVQKYKKCNFCKTEHPYTKKYWFASNGKLTQCRVWKAHYNEVNKEHRAIVRSAYHARTREVQSIKQKAKYAANPEPFKQRSVKYRQENLEHCLIRDRIANQEWYAVNKDLKWEHTKNRLETDLAFKIKVSLRGRLYHAVADKIKVGSAVKDVGTTIDALIIYLESKFYPHPVSGETMTWKNWNKKGWHLDHIKPLASFDLTDKIQFDQANHYSNLQPLWKEDHIQKTIADKKLIKKGRVSI